MRSFLQAAGSLVVASLSAVAFDTSLVRELEQAAQRVERDATTVHRALKSKKPDPVELKAKIDSMSIDVATLDKLVKAFEASQPSLSDQEQQLWAQVRERVQLLGIFHENKRRLAADDLTKHRTMVRAFANGVAERAKKLQTYAAQLQRPSIS